MPTPKRRRSEELTKMQRIHDTAGADFRNTAHWRIFRIMAEFIDGFQFLADLKKEVTIFGSARSAPGDYWYEQARMLGQLLGRAKYTVITGGGPGIMEAANQGCAEVNGMSVGLNIKLPQEQQMNGHVKQGMGFHYFFTRKVMLSASAQAYIFFPGGFGTMDEMTEMVELIQTGKMQSVPVILVGKEFWSGYLDWVRRSMRDAETPLISAADLDLMMVVDSAVEAFAIVKRTKERPYF